MRKQKFEQKKQQFEECLEILRSKSYSPNELSEYGIEISKDGIKRNGMELFTHPLIETTKIMEIFPEIKNFSQEVLQSVEITAKYLPYLEFHGMHQCL
jgi:tRNA U34 5-carboxymethylaminomethyl modifying enzyme MnmG/GidA